MPTNNQLPPNDNNDDCCHSININHVSLLLMRRILNEAPGMFEFWAEGFFKRLVQVIAALKRKYPTCPYIDDINSTTSTASVVLYGNGGTMTEDRIEEFFNSLDQY